MGIFIDRVGEIGYNNQGEKMTIIRCGKLKGQRRATIDIEFEDGTILYNKYYGNFQKGKIKHPIRYEESIAYYIEVELGLNINDIWNWGKNDKLNINPYETYKYSDKKVWLYCQEKDYHNYDREGDKIGYEISCNRFSQGKRCGYCNSSASHKIHWKDSLAYNYPQIAKMIAIEENNLTFDDCYNIACYSNKKFYFKCNLCDSISTNKKTLSLVMRQKYSCEFCSDGISIPNKFMANILKQLNVDFITELSKSNFEWCGYYRYDFYLPKYNMIIEVNGLQHYESSGKNSSWNSLKQEQWNDLFKYKCAKNHVDNYIVVDCRYSELEWMKENIIKELGEYFNSSNIDWKLAWEESQNSKVIECWKYYKNGLIVKDIAKIIGISENTVYEYIRKYKNQLNN